MNDDNNIKISGYLSLKYLKKKIESKKGMQIFSKS